MPEVAVVIPCFNYGRFLTEAVESVLGQTSQDFEIVIVDDGSTEAETLSLLDDCQWPKTKVVRTENRGPAAARNTGIKNSDSLYVVSLDADDRLHPEYLEKTAAVFNADNEKRLGFVTTQQRRFGDENGPLDAGDGSLITLAMVNNIHASALFRRSVWEEVGGYRESFTGWEDWNLWLNMTAAGYGWEVVPEELFYYRKHGETRSSRSLRNRQKLFDAIFEDNAAFYLKHHSEIIKAYFVKQAKLDKVWLEKHEALQDNEKLSGQLEQEQASHQKALKEYRKLEEHYHDLMSNLKAAQDSRTQAELRIRELEERCQDLESALEASKEKVYQPLDSE